MAARPQRAVVIGLDAASPELLLRYADEGALPNIARLLARGSFARTYTPLPTITPGNWTTIATGALPGTHGISDFLYRLPTDPPGVEHNAFSSLLCRAEYLWDAFERGGRRSILMKDSGCWPPTMRHGYQVDGCGPDLRANVHEVCEEQLWLGAPPGLETVEALAGHLGLSLVPHDAAVVPVDEPLALRPHLWRPRRVPVAVGGSRLLLPEWDVTLRPGEWSPWVTAAVAPEPDPVGWSRYPYTDQYVRNVAELQQGFRGPGSPVTTELPAPRIETVEAALRFKLLALNAQTGAFALYSSQAYPTRSFTFPDELGPELVRRFGGFLQRPSWHGITHDWIDAGTYFELHDYQINWFADAAAYLGQRMRSETGDPGEPALLMVQEHLIDHACHLWLNGADPLSGRPSGFGNHLPDPGTCRSLIRRAYEACDRLVGRMVEVAGDDAVVAIVSDHGAKAAGRAWPTAAALARAGLLVFRQRPSQLARPEIDWGQTRAYVHHGMHVYVNLAGREPQGIVPPERFLATVEEIVRALVTSVDPETGRSPHALVLRQEDARATGLGAYGPHFGDVIAILRGDYGGHHGPFLADTRFGMSSTAAVLLLAGPGIQPGRRLDGAVWIQDLAPTLAHLLGLPCPRQAEGKVLYEALV